MQLGDVRIELVRKPIRNLHLSVYPPIGRVRIAAPERATDESIRLFAISKIGWIKRQQGKLRTQERESPRQYIERESHYVWGRRYLLRVIERDAPPRIELTPRRLVLGIRPGTSREHRRQVMEAWYRRQLRVAVPPLVEKWQKTLRVQTNRVFIQRMKTRWGGSNPETKNIRLNTDLAKKPVECLEYIVLHEITHLRVPRHDAAFVALLDRSLPNWRESRDRLNRLPISSDR
ncbi:MAG TPA: SprT family zinc-dependent metalloprotease [Rhodanobacteraceae bacterium]|nr:SprT family zinc-dependent metalloprotease [Rhodanobacteraceae bacterium]